MTSQRDIVTLSFIGKSLDMSVDDVVKYFIILLIIVFDPLAICLLLAYNTMLPKNENGGNYDAVGELPISTKGEIDVDTNKKPNTTFKKILRKPFEYVVKNKNTINNGKD